MANSPKVSLKLVIDKERNRVVFVESDKDFVDIVFNFLTLPLGTIIRILRKNSSPSNCFPLGCFNNIYQSIENLDAEYFETDASKAMLLQPRGAYERHFQHLKLNINDQNPREIYKCPDSNCHMKSFRLYSLVPGTRCGCEKSMEVAFTRASIEENKDGVYFKAGAERFLATDDFHVMSARTTHCLALLSKLGIRDMINLEKRDVEIGQEEILNLFERFLLSKTALSDVFLESNNQVTVHNMEVIKGKELTEQSEVESDTNDDKTSIELKLFVNKENDEAVYAEANGEFINLLFSFLTFPLGSVIELLDKPSPLMCAENLYKSVEALVESDVELLKSKECEAMLLHPKLAPYFGWSNQIVNVGEMLPVELTYSDLEVSINLVNPKLPHPGKNGAGGRFVKGSTFMVTGDLVVMPMSLVAAIDLINGLRVPITSLEERIINIGEAEALNLLKAALISHNALSSAFSSKKRRNNRRHY